jgi:hypothetical protein
MNSDTISNDKINEIAIRRKEIDGEIGQLYGQIDALRDEISKKSAEKWNLNKELDKYCKHEYETTSWGYNNDDYTYTCKVCGKIR